MKFCSAIPSLICAAAAMASWCQTASADEKVEFFEAQIRPLLANQCLSCHGSDRQDGDIRLDSRAAILAGGRHGTLVIESNATSSRLVKAVRGESATAAPACVLKAPAEQQAIALWVEQGLSWPEGKTITDSGERDAATRDHWAFQPVREPTVPGTVAPEKIATPIDAFVLARLAHNQLDASPQADRRTLIRRASYAITGLPPSADEVEQFVNDSDPEAYEKLIDRLLASPHYGEQWARHWLDVARYSDTKGYVYAREERFWPHAWAYRDWIVEALNKDLAYDRFLLLQLAADQVEDRQPQDLAAMGFLTLGRRFLGIQRDIIDDRIDVVTRGMLGLTVSCARCHDHKYDPIPTADYYSLYGVFASSQEQLIALGDESSGGEAFQTELKKRRLALSEAMLQLRNETSKRARERIGDYLFAQTELAKYPANGFDQIFAKDDLLPAFVYRWTDYLEAAQQGNDPIFAAWHAYAGLPEQGFADAAANLQWEKTKLHPLVAKAFLTPPASMKDVAERYAKLFTDPVDATLRRVIEGPAAPCVVPDQPIVQNEVFFDSASVTKLWKLQGEVDRWIISAKADVPFALAMQDRRQPVTPRIFVRGDPLKRGDQVPRQFLKMLSGDDRLPFKKGSGRLEMAQAIIDPANPLTARVIVNRVWTHYFGQGLVSTPSDFGTRADAPSHPELLDWLASQLISEGWSLKKLHRTILLSNTFQQATNGPADDATFARAKELDPGNRLLWRMTAQRQSFENFRDSMLVATGQLDPAVGGKPVELLKPPYMKRRTLYGRVDRQFLPGLLRNFDFANPDLHIAQRSETTVPQQSLFFMNHPLVLQRARDLAALAEKPSITAPERVAVMFRQVLQREPAHVEVEEALNMIDSVAPIAIAHTPPTAGDWQYGYGAFNDKTQRVSAFEKLPHFNGKAWQGGPNWPDAKLGWVQLTAEGGHPGNNREHGAVRRWTAPRTMTIDVRTQLTHEPAAGDGIRAFIVSSRVGKLAAATIHQKNIDLNLESFQVEAGETIDFVVDIGEVLNSDQYLWSVALSSDSDNGENSLTWNAETDFPRDEAALLTAWEQLAQALFCSNEFMFVD